MRKVIGVMGTLIDNLIPGVTGQAAYSIPVSSIGSGLVDTTRGALGHWLKIQNQKISFYQVITPSVWNLSSHANDGTPGTAEQALIGTEIADENSPVEIGRIIRSFDPCVSCATHVYYSDREPKFIPIVP